MKKFFVTIFVVTLVFGLAGMADVYALDITVYDENSDSSSNTWWNTTNEDEEVEPGMQTGQKWDLEAFLYEGTELSMVGGFNFLIGEWGNNYLWESGDIFIDVNNDAKYGDLHNSLTAGNKEVTDTYGYDYVLDLDFTTLTYSVYQLFSGVSKTVTTYYAQNQGSNPWRYHSGGELFGNYSGLSFSYETGKSDTDVGFSGGSHNIVSGFDLGFLGDLGYNSFTVHFTMQCGNDNLMGHYDPIPEPSTLLLLGAGLIGLLALGRKRFNK